MDRMDELFTDPLKYSVLDRGTQFASNLKVLIQSRLGDSKNKALPYRLKRTGGQFLEVHSELKNYRRYEEMSLGTKGSNWAHICGATSTYDYAYCKEFDYGVDYFSMVAQFYLGILECGEFSFDNLINGTAEEREEFLGGIGFVVCGDSIRDELLEYVGIYSVKEADDIAALALILSTAYVYYDIHGMRFPKKWREQLSKTWQQMYILKLEMDEDIEIPVDTAKLEEEYEDVRKEYILTYLDYFLKYLQSYFIKESKSVYPDVIPMLMSVLFGFHVSEDGTPLCLYYFSLKELKEYENLKEKHPDSSYVERMDKMLPILMDPAQKKEDAYGGYCPPWDEENAVVMEYGFYDEEYVCVYMYYADADFVIPDAFPMTASYFHYLLEEFKKEVENNERMVKAS